MMRNEIPRLRIGAPRRPAAIAASLALAATACPLLAAAPAAAKPVIVSPQAGTPTASPQTQISVAGVASNAIERVTTIGSRSGRHRGSLRAYSSHRGASFVPARPFRAGERVHVRIEVRGRKARKLSFRIARFAPLQPPLEPPPDFKLDLSKLDRFATQPFLLAPRFTVTRGAAGPPGSSLLMTPLPAPVIHPDSPQTLTVTPVGPGGPMIVDRQGRLVWFHQLAPPHVAGNLRVQRYRGHRVLTWWEGVVEPAAFGLGVGTIADHSYRTVAKVRAGNGYSADIHELTLTGGRKALITAYRPVRIRVHAHGRTRTQIALDSLVQEIDVPTGLVVWEWHAMGHIPLADSVVPRNAGSVWDPFHLNSIQPLRHGSRLLVSARDTSAIYEIERASGRIRWTLGGKHSTFRMGHGARFAFQHDAQLHRGSRVSLFDDEGGPPFKASTSRGLVLALNHRKRTARVARTFLRPQPTLANSEGNVQMQPGGGALVGFGATQFVSRFDRRGELRFDAHLPAGDSTYRAYLARWQATPAAPPDAVATRTGPGAVTVAASWNGATRVRRWQVLAPDPSGALAPVASAAAHGFETTIRLHTSAPRIAVRALDASGAPLRTSATVAVSG